MTVTAQYLDAAHTQIQINLEPGDSFGTENVPAELKDDKGNIIVPAGQPRSFTVGLALGNREHDALFPDAVLKTDGIVDQGTPSISIADYVVPPTPVPSSIPMFRADIVLQTTYMPSDPNTTIMDAANAFINNIPDAKTKLIAQSAFNKAPELFRNSPTLAAVVNYLKEKDSGITDAFIDNLFVEAMAIPI